MDDDLLSIMSNNPSTPGLLPCLKYSCEDLVDPLIALNACNNPVYRRMMKLKYGVN